MLVSSRTGSPRSSTTSSPSLPSQSSRSGSLSPSQRQLIATATLETLAEWLAVAVAEAADRDGDAGDAGGEMGGVPRRVDAAAEADGEPVGGHVPQAVLSSLKFAAGCAHGGHRRQNLQAIGLRFAPARVGSPRP